MKNIVTAFFMAWGNFLSLPCPYRHWDGKLKNMMLGFLPLIGFAAGLLWFGLGVFITFVGVPVILSSFAMTFFIYAVCGFMHMDGFMDVNDAVMSRRPLEERRRILKDSNVGAFAVITVVFLVLASLSSMISFLASEPAYADLLVLTVIPVASRAASGACVLNFKPMETSQYLEAHSASRTKYTIMLAVFAVAVTATAAAVGTVWNNCGGAAGTIKPVGTALVTFFATFTACLYAKCRLDGMNGDIAGYSICAGEVAGLVFIALF